MMKDTDKFRGCLIGGAVGDALGYPVEFMNEEDIFQKYGDNGITKYMLTDKVAEVSDDTQMTLFTANGLLAAEANNKDYLSYISLCYKDWLLTQVSEQLGKQPQSCSWLNNVEEMHHSREPGRSCLTAIMEGANGTIEYPLNNSKGCGGIMRVAPIGLYFEDNTGFKVDLLAAKTAALTHGHELGYISAAVLAHIVWCLSHTDMPLLSAVADAKSAAEKLFGNAMHLKQLIRLIDKATELSKKDVSDLEAIKELGEGWVAEETLAIAIYCALKHSDDFEKAVIAAVNHSGDSDSTGSVTGNILGAYLGLSKIPDKFIQNLELFGVIKEIADDLCCSDCKSKIWTEKYIEHTYTK